MIRVIALLALVVSLPAVSAPFVVGDILDVATQVCPYTLDGATVAGTVPVVQDSTRGKPENAHRVCLVDAAPLQPGSYTIRMKARNNDQPEVWLESAWSPPFTFARSGVLRVPETLRLIP